MLEYKEFTKDQKRVKSMSSMSLKRKHKSAVLPAHQKRAV